MDGLIALALAKKYTDEHGGGLPEVTTDDNGKVLGVSGGAWTKITPESGTIPTITIDMSQMIDTSQISDNSAVSDDTLIVVQLTAEQVDIFKSDAPVINMNFYLAPEYTWSMKLFDSSDMHPGSTIRSTAVSKEVENENFYMSAHIDSDDKCYIDKIIMSEIGYGLTYWLQIQRFGDASKVYELAHEFVTNDRAHIPQLRVDMGTGASNLYIPAFHCSSITPITGGDGYHCVFIHDEYDDQVSKMAYTVFSFDIDSSYNVTNQSYDTHYAV